MRILIISFRKNYRRRLERLLKEVGYEDVVSAGSMDEARYHLSMDECHRIDIDLIMMDLYVPKGIENKGKFLDELCSFTRAKPMENMPVILIKNRQDKDMEVEVGSRFRDCLTKPVSGPLLAARVQWLLRLKQEMTSRKAFEKKLQKSEDFFQTVFDRTPTGIAFIDVMGKYKKVNQYFCDILGYSGQELLDLGFQDITHPDDIKNDHGRLYNLLAGDSNVMTWEKRYIRKDGELIWARIKAVKISLDPDRPDFIMSVVEDITQERKVKTALKESERRFREMAAIVPAIFWIQSPDGGKMYYVSPAYERIYGASTQDMFKDGFSWLNYIHPDDRAKVVRSMKENYDREKNHLKSYTCEFRIIRPDGSIRWLIDSFMPTSPLSNEPPRVIGFGIDVTNLKEIEATLQKKEQELRRQTEKLQKVNTALEVLVKHREDELLDIEKNMLTTLEKLIFPYLEQLKILSQDKNQNTYLEIIESNLSKIVSPLAKRLSTWQTKLSPTEIRVANLVREGMSTKEIAALLYVSTNAVSAHRRRIRAKLDIANKGINLVSYLQSLSV